MSTRSSSADLLLVAVLLYRSPELIEGLFSALAACGDEISRLCGHVLLINDSPDDEALGSALAAALPALRRRVGVELLVNPVNMGFVKSANRALELGRVRRADVILLNSDTIPTPGAFAEMAAVAGADPMISVVSPRSNNATLCNSPCPASFRLLEGMAAERAHRAVERYLPRVSYVPTAVGFCLYVRCLMIEEFGVFDEVYGGGYNEENDFIMRCNRAGYRAVLANHAFVHHLGGVSFKQSAVSPGARERSNSLILRERFPYYDRSVQRYFKSAEFRTQWLLAGLVPDEKGRLRILLDGRNIGAYYNGTFEHTLGLIKAFAKAFANDFSIHLVCTPEIAAFHGFDRIEGVHVCDPTEVGETPFAVVFRVAQPFSLTHLTDLGDLAPLTGFMFLDSISMDCLELDDVDYRQIWSWMTQTIALIGFNSRFTEQQFKRRFDLPPDVVDFVSPCSTDVEEYQRHTSTSGRSNYILVIGNHYAHKHVAQTVRRLRAHTDKHLVVLGGADLIPDARTQVYKAGELEQSVVDGLYDRADFIVFPSHYEGFGLPIMHALARGKPVIARAIEPSREIRSSCSDAINLHLYETTDQMAQAAAKDVAWRETQSRLTPWTWADAAQALRDAIVQAVERCDYASVHARVIRLDRLGGAKPVVMAETQRKQVPKTFLTPERLQDLAMRSVGDGQSTSASTNRLTVEVLDAGEQDSVLMARILDAVDQMEDHDLFVLDLPRDAFYLARAKLLLLSAGLAPESPREADGRVQVAARLFVRWVDTVSSSVDDVGFVEGAYGAALGRASDPGGRTNYLRELGEGLDRRAMLRLMFASTERLQFVAEMHGHTMDPHGVILPLDANNPARIGIDLMPAAA